MGGGGMSATITGEASIFIPPSRCFFLNDEANRLVASWKQHVESPVTSPLPFSTKQPWFRALSRPGKNGGSGVKRQPRFDTVSPRHSSAAPFREEWIGSGFPAVVNGDGVFPFQRRSLSVLFGDVRQSKEQQRQWWRLARSAKLDIGLEPSRILESVPAFAGKQEADKVPIGLREAFLHALLRMACAQGLLGNLEDPHSSLRTYMQTNRAKGSETEIAEHVKGGRMEEPVDSIDVVNKSKYLVADRDRHKMSGLSRGRIDKRHGGVASFGLGSSRRITAEELVGLVRRMGESFGHPPLFQKGILDSQSRNLDWWGKMLPPLRSISSLQASSAKCSSDVLESRGRISSEPRQLARKIQAEIKMWC
nr:hypothetical protein Iba_chr03fCG3520 [Ipomoea batatas]